MGTSVSERDILRNLMGKLAGYPEKIQREILQEEVSQAPSLFSDVFDALRRVAARVVADGVAPSVACERELRLLAGVDEA